MKDLDSNTSNVPSKRDSLSINEAIHTSQSCSSSDYWLREFIKINQCPQREDALENQLKDLCLIADKFGLVYASEFIKNYCKIKTEK